MTADEILNRLNLKRTGCREGILDVVLAGAQPLSEHEIRERLAGKYDRTTFYRSFKTLEKHRVIHKIVVDNQMVKYALNNAITHKEEHVHFYCNECQGVTCLEDVPIQHYTLPSGFSDNETEVLIKGTCANCKTLK